MTEALSFKAYLKREGQEVEVRRFCVDGGAGSNYTYLKAKLQSMFPSLQKEQFSIFWQDGDNDYVTIESDEELMECLTSVATQPFKLYVHAEPGQKTTQGGKSSAGPQTHPGVVCDGCDGPVVGYRYKCLVCPDYDLCATCEGNGQHPEHYVVRMPTSTDFSSHPKFFRKFFGRPHHKFHKRHGWNHAGPDMGGCNETAGPGQCPYSRREGPRPGVPHMFDFSAMADLVSNVYKGAAPSQAPQGQTTNPPDEASTSGQNNNNQESDTSAGQTQSGPQPDEYLTGVGRAIAAILDPFDLPTKKRGKLEKKLMKKNRKIIVGRVLKHGKGFKHFGQGPKRGFGHRHGLKHHGPKQRFDHGPGLKQGFDHDHGLKHGLRHGHGPHRGSGRGHGAHRGSGHGHGPHRGFGHGHGPHRGSGRGHGPHHGSGHGHGPHHRFGRSHGPHRGSGDDSSPHRGSGDDSSPHRGSGDDSSPHRGSGHDHSPHRGSGRGHGAHRGFGHGRGSGHGHGAHRGFGHSHSPHRGSGHGPRRGFGHGHGPRRGFGHGHGPEHKMGYGPEYICDLEPMNIFEEIIDLSDDNNEGAGDTIEVACIETNIESN